jgi:hypothetical protein
MQKGIRFNFQFHCSDLKPFMTLSTIDNSLDTMQLEVFFKVLNIIERNNIEWFLGRPGENSQQDRDTLANHVSIDASGFTFKPNSELPQCIRAQCDRAYALLFCEN